MFGSGLKHRNAIRIQIGWLFGSALVGEKRNEESSEERMNVKEGCPYRKVWKPGRISWLGSPHDEPENCFRRTCRRSPASEREKCESGDSEITWKRDWVCWKVGWVIKMKNIGGACSNDPTFVHICVFVLLFNYYKHFLILILYGLFHWPLLLWFNCCNGW